MDICETLPELDVPEDVDPKPDEYQTALTKLSKHFLPKRNLEYKRYVFREARQQNGETVDTYHAHSCSSFAAACDFANKNEEVKSQITRGCIPTHLRRRALGEEMTLTQLLDLARSLELADLQATSMEKGTTVAEVAVNMVQPRKTHRGIKSNSKNDHKKQHGQVRKSTYCSCGGEYLHSTTCPAKGSTCDACGKNPLRKILPHEATNNKTCDFHACESCPPG